MSQVERLLLKGGSKSQILQEDELCKILGHIFLYEVDPAEVQAPFQDFKKALGLLMPSKS